MEHPGARLARISAWYDEPAPTLLKSSRGHLLLAAWPAGGPFTGVARRGTAMAVTSHVPGGPHSHDVMTFCDAMTGGSVLDVPIPAAAATLTDDELAVAGDVVGYGRVYWWHNDEQTLVSNRLAAPVLFAGHAPDADVAAWVAFAAGHQFFRDATPFVGIRRFESCTRWVATDTPNETTPAESDDFKRQLASGDSPSLPEVGKAMVDRLQAARHHLPGVEFTAGLTGGFDSRVAVGAAIAAGIQPTCQTTHPPELEGVVASQLFQRLPADTISWKSRDRTSSRWLPVPGESGNNSADDLLARAMAWHHQYDGNYVASYLPSRPSRVLNEQQTGVTLSGVVGEAARSQYFWPGNLVRDDVDHQVGSTLDIYLGHQYTKILPTKPIATARQNAMDLITQARDRGVESFHVLNHYFVFGRLPRFAGGNLGTEAITPLGVPSFILRGVNQSLQEKVDNQQHRDLAVRFVPGWRGVAYDAELRSKLPDLAVVDPPSILMSWESGYGPAMDELFHEPALSDLMDVRAARKGLADQRRRQRSDRAAFDLNITSAAVWYLGFLRHRLALQAAIDGARDSCT